MSVLGDGIVEGIVDSANVDAMRERYQTVPPAVTPIRGTDFLQAVKSSRRGRGRELFKQDIEQFLDVSYTATYTSFRRALCAPLLKLQRNTDRTKVVLPAYSCPDFVEAIEGAGLDVTYCDVNPKTLTMDVEEVAGHLDDETLAVVAVHLLGFGNRIDRLATLCDVHDVFLVEALGYSFGTEYEDQRLGTVGDCTVLNFQEGKPIPVGGGMIATDHQALARPADERPAVAPNYLPLFGYIVCSRSLFYSLYERLLPIVTEVDGLAEYLTTHPESKYDADYHPPFARMSHFQGALAHRIFRQFNSHKRARARTAGFYTDALAPCDHVHVIEPAAGITSVQYTRFPILVESPALRTELQQALTDAGITATPLYERLALDPQEYPGADRLRQCLLTLPTHPYVTSTDRQRVVDVIQDVSASFEEPSRPGLGKQRPTNHLS